MWLDIEYTNRDLIPDSAVVRMLVAIRTTIFYVSRPVPAASEGYGLALAELRQIMAAHRGDKELFERAGFSQAEVSQVLQMLAATRD